MLLQNQLVLAICKVLSAAGVDLTDTTCELVEQFVSEIIKTM